MIGTVTAITCVSKTATSARVCVTAKCRSLQEQVAAEGLAVPADPHAHNSWMNGVHWIDATFRETPRLYPSVRTLVRQSESDDLVGDHLLPGGTVYVASQSGGQRDSREFADPLRFELGPWEEERVQAVRAATDGGAAVHTRPLLSYFPFDGGNRFCIG